MTSSHTLASITADLITNGIPRHFGAFAEDTSEEAQFPKHLCWFLDESIVDERSLWLCNPGLHTPAAEISWEFIPCLDGWSLVSTLLEYCETRGGLIVQVDRDYTHTTIRQAVEMIASIDDYHAKRSIKAN